MLSPLIVNTHMWDIKDTDGLGLLKAAYSPADEMKCLTQEVISEHGPHSRRRAMVFQVHAHVRSEHRHLRAVPQGTEEKSSWAQETLE